MNVLDRTFPFSRIAAAILLAISNPICAAPLDVENLPIADADSAVSTTRLAEESQNLPKSAPVQKFETFEGYLEYLKGRGWKVQLSEGMKKNLSEKGSLTTEKFFDSTAGKNPLEIFLDGMEKAGVFYFYDGETLHLTQDDEAARLLKVGGDSGFERLKTVLRNSRIISDEEFERIVTRVGNDDGDFGGEFLLVAHPALVKRIGNVVKAVNGEASKPKSPPEFEKRVIRLNHAFAKETVFKGQGDVEFKIPGVVDLLNQMVGLPTDSVTASLAVGRGLVPLDSETSTSPPSESNGGENREASLTPFNNSDGGVPLPLVVSQSQPVFPQADLRSLIAVDQYNRVDEALFTVGGGSDLPSINLGEALEMIDGNADLVKNAWQGLSKGQRSSFIDRIFDKGRAIEIAQVLGVQEEVQNSSEPKAKETLIGALEEHAKKEEQAKEKLTLRGAKRTITADVNQNAIVIMDYKDNIKFYEEIIRELDQPINLVEVSVSVIDLLTSNDLDWQTNILGAGAGDVNGQSVAFVGGSNTSATPGTTPAGPLGPVIDGTSKLLDSSLTGVDGLDVSSLVVGQSYRILGRIRALQTTGDARILSRPTLLTMDNTQAVISDDSLFHVRVEGDENSELYRISAGLTVRIKPHIIEHQSDHDHGPHPGRRVRLLIHINDGSFLSNTPANSIDDIPQSTKSIITTHAIVAENQSLLIGGRYRKAESSTEGRVPLIGRLPVVGLPFKDKYVSNRMVQRLFLITPRILDVHDFHESGGQRIQDIVSPGFEFSAHDIKDSKGLVHLVVAGDTEAGLFLRHQLNKFQMEVLEDETSFQEEKEEVVIRLLNDLVEGSQKVPIAESCYQGKIPIEVASLMDKDWMKLDASTRRMLNRTIIDSSIPSFVRPYRIQQSWNLENEAESVNAGMKLDVPMVDENASRGFFRKIIHKYKEDR